MTTAPLTDAELENLARVKPLVSAVDLNLFRRALATIDVRTADIAALRETLQRLLPYFSSLSTSAARDEADRIVALLATPNPGAALLSRLEADIAALRAKLYEVWKAWEDDPDGYVSSEIIDPILQMHNASNPGAALLAWLEAAEKDRAVAFVTVATMDAARVAANAEVERLTTLNRIERNNADARRALLAGACTERDAMRAERDRLREASKIGASEFAHEHMKTLNDDLADRDATVARLTEQRDREKDGHRERAHQDETMRRTLAQRADAAEARATTLEAECAAMRAALLAASSNLDKPGVRQWCLDAQSRDAGRAYAAEHEAMRAVVDAARRCGCPCLDDALAALDRVQAGGGGK